MRAIKGAVLGLLVLSSLNSPVQANDEVCSARQDLVANCSVVFGRLDCRDLTKIAIVDFQNGQRYIVDKHDARFESEQKLFATMKSRCETGNEADGAFQVCPLSRATPSGSETSACIDRVVFAQGCLQTAMTQADLNDCAHLRYAASKKKLAVVVDGLMNEETKEGQKRLLKAQKLWSDYIEAQCAFETMGAEGGSVSPMIYTDCLRQLTDDQTEHLTK